MANTPFADVPSGSMPAHIGIILDGNGRWAKKRGLPRSAGHRQGADTFGKIARHCREIGVKYLTVYAFSTENWKRPPDEVEALMDLLRRYLTDTYKHRDENARLRFLGERGPLSSDIREMIERVEHDSAANTAINVNIALNYGGRDEIVHAARAIAKQCSEGTLDWKLINEHLLSETLYTAGQPDPDLIIRPSGEQRISNFLLWQSAYAEFVFMDVLWPDFTPAHLDQAIRVFLSRNRRFGGV